MTDVEKFIKEINQELRSIENAYRKNGSTYSLIVRISEMTVSLLRVVLDAMDTEHYDEAFKVHKKGHALRQKLLAKISMEDLHVLSKHGNTDADWIIAGRLRDEHADEFNSEEAFTQETIWSEYLDYLERGVSVYKMNASSALRALFLSEQLLDGAKPEIEKAISYLKVVSEEASDPDAAEAHYSLWSIYLDELNDVEIAKFHLMAAVELKHPDATAAYGRAHWGDWLVQEDERKAFRLIREASDLGSEWGSELLAMAYADGIGTKKNAPKAFKIRMDLGEDDSAENCFLLAEHFLDGAGVNQDELEGKRLLKKAMKMGSGRAHFTAAHEIDISENRKKLAKKRFEILKAAQDLDDPFTLTFNDLARCYFHGDGTKQDFGKARECFESLLDLGSIESYEAEAELYLKALAGKNPEEELNRILEES